MTDEPTLPDQPAMPESDAPQADQPAAPPPVPGDLPTSYAEKYRGTPWGRPESPQPAPTSSGGPPWLIIIGLAVIAVAVAGLLVFATSSPGGLPGQAAAATPAAGGSGAGESSGASPTPTPTPDPGVAIKGKFWALVSGPNASYHVTGKGRSVFDGKTYETFSESIDVVGDNYAGTLKSHGKGPLLAAIQPSRIKSARIARKDGVVWLKEAGKRATSRRSSARSDRLTPFLYIDLPGVIDYVKPVSVAGRRLHLLRTNKYYRPDIARMIDTARFNVEPDRMTLDVYVTDDGVPVKAVFTVYVSGSDQIGKHHVFHAQTDFAFAKFGAKLPIRVPKR
jgi:hypothetical protein